MRNLIPWIYVIIVLMACGTKNPYVAENSASNKNVDQDDLEVLAATIDYVERDVDNLDDLRSSEEYLIVIRQTLPIKYCGFMPTPSIVPDEKGYLKMQDAKRQELLDDNCEVATAIRSLMLEFSDLGTNIFVRNKTCTFLTTIPVRHRIQMMDRAIVRAIIKKSWWDGLYKLYPIARGVLEISLPGYSSTR